MISEVRSGLSPGAQAQTQVANAAKVPNNAPKVAQVAPAFEPVVMKKADIKVDTEQMRQNLQQAINHLNEMMKDGGRGLNFTMDNTLSQPIVYVKNSETGEVVRQIPNEVVVRVAHSIEELKGLLHNKSV